MLAELFVILRKIRKRLFGDAYTTIQEDQFSLLLAQALSKILQVQKGKSRLVTAYTDSELYRLTEALSDIGFIWEDSLRTFFGGDPQDRLHPYNPLSDLEKFEFDVVLGPSGINLSHFVKSARQALKSIKYSNFKSCLNLHKIATLAALVYFCPNQCSILEVGAYQCGTTIFMAQLCKILGKRVKIYACDTFEGMPAATTSDRSDPVYYDSGMFLDNPIEKVKRRIRNQGLENSIRLVKGDVVETLPNLSCENIYLMFLDTDQYKGTKAGLDLVKRLNTKPHIVVDDASLSSVSLAIDEFVGKENSYSRKNLSKNFDYVFPTPMAIR